MTSVCYPCCVKPNKQDRSDDRCFSPKYWANSILIIYKNYLILLIERVAVFITHPFQPILKLKKLNCAFSQLLDKNDGSMTAVAINHKTSTEPPSFGYVRESNNSKEILLAM
tara:strand:+ start:109 stop:444 length:336 start_codon:yes stop_codon:yes gene_type:complete